ncbi:hypothetical protein ACIQXA_28360 [Streptomyces massasporeus]|uniref:hypothetical protein n=1 Tax=Streptomyces massasporeus TaxID=67324 RepID=UPI0037FDF27B
MKKGIAAAGLVLGAAAMVVTTQASAQAQPAVPTTPVVQQAASVDADADMKPAAIGGLVKAAGKAVGKAATKAATKAGKAAKNAAGKGYVHAKAAGSTRAIRNSVGNMVRIASLGASPAKTGTAQAESVESIFDK